MPTTVPHRTSNRRVSAKTKLGGGGGVRLNSETMSVSSSYSPAEEIAQNGSPP
jgi:hypothetical protein